MAIDNSTPRIGRRSPSTFHTTWASVIPSNGIGSVFVTVRTYPVGALFLDLLTLRMIPFYLSHEISVSSDRLRKFRLETNASKLAFVSTVENVRSLGITESMPLDIFQGCGFSLPSKSCSRGYSRQRGGVLVASEFDTMVTPLSRLAATLSKMLPIPRVTGPNPYSKSQEACGSKEAVLPSQHR